MEIEKSKKADCEVITLFSLAAQLPKQSKSTKSQGRGHVPVPNHQHPTTWQKDKEDDSSQKLHQQKRQRQACGKRWNKLREKRKR